MSLLGLIGIFAAFCTTVAFIPQIIKLRKQGGKDLSYPMLFLYLIGVILWLVYGLMIHAAAVIWANALAVLFVTICLALKATIGNKTGATPERLRIAVDMDEVIADSFSKHLRHYNEQTGEKLTHEMVTRKGLKPLIPDHHRETYNRVPFADNFFGDLEVIDGSRAALEKLSEKHDVFITSAAMDVPTSFDAKYKWLEQHFPFIPPARIVFCGDKHIINADVLIDDRSRHFKKFRGIGILFTAPHNASEAAPLRANNWDEVLQIIANHGAHNIKEKQQARTLSMSPAES
ncbi:MAG TPA: SemiSWEET family transporter [Terriglobales bacterium]